MKQLTVYGLAFLLVTVTSAALAGGRGHGGHHGGHHYKHGARHFDHYRPYPRHRYYGGFYRSNYYYPDYFGAALLGSALSYSLYHTHNGASCYDNHSNDRYQQRTGGYSEVVGCHRIERLPDGSERRIEVPMSQCQ